MFSKALLKWYDKYGRQDLPWRLAINPYRVWLSEIMLQQTQVKTVINYFYKFIEAFPSVIHLADASEDSVLHLWSGLGYYSRARNLHKTAKIIRDKFNGEFPVSVEQLQTLPGIGRSTAGAIAAIAFNLQEAILDGNVKRVLSRYLAIKSELNKPAVINQLWLQAKAFTPKKRPADYTQAIMDLGATICTRSKPKCDLCPLKNYCQAYKLKLTAQIPLKKSKKAMPKKSQFMLVIQNKKDEILLQKRPSAGIWGGLWCLPVCEIEEDIIVFCAKELGVNVSLTKKLAAIEHRFTHFHLTILPVQLKLLTDKLQCRESNDRLWYHPTKLQKIGLATPVKKILIGVTA